MPYYNSLKYKPTEERIRIVSGIQRIREQLQGSTFPKKKAKETLILGTWNIRNFDDNRFDYGHRSTESLFYLAEIISHFDVIAVQEIAEDLWPLKKLIRLLGEEQYDYIVTDVTHSSLGGNKERLGFIYDKGKVHFTGVTGEIVLPEKMLISETDDVKRQFSRTPFGVEFQSGWFIFTFSTVHIFFGSNRGNTPQFKRRVKEIKAIANYLAKEAKKSDSNHILVGDFNIVERGSDGFNALEESGFKTVNNRLGSNRDQTKYYDQISFISRRNELEFMEPDRDDRVIQFFDSVYREEDFPMYREEIIDSIRRKIRRFGREIAKTTSERKKTRLGKKVVKLEQTIDSEELLRKYYDEWRTFQMSDHLPLWVEIKIDFTDAYLRKLKTS